MGIKHDVTHPRGALWGADHVVAGAAEGDILKYIGGEWVPIGGAASGLGREVLMQTGVADPPDPLISTDGTDWLYGAVST